MHTNREMIVENVIIMMAKRIAIKAKFLEQISELNHSKEEYSTYLSI